MGSKPSVEPVSAAEMAVASKLLMGGVRRCNPDIVKKALASRADPNIRSEHSGRPALSFAAQCAAASGGRRPDQADTTLPLQHLLAARAQVDAAADDGRTALHLAVAWERGPAVAKLVEAGASTSLPDKHGLSPQELARRRNNVSI
ncbi:unnamed protein product [Effrenium voratum]|nr:unnamed protein product [Effrenium voratum]CAJ1422232.1 unnamed protein product [Effrenium voratum]